MQIKLLTSLANPDNPKNAGDVIDVDQAEAIRHIAAGHAIPHGESKIETPEKPKAIERRASAKKSPVNRAAKKRTR